MENTETICAISTPLGVGGIAVIRISGNDALNIASKVFYNSNTQTLDFEPRKMYLGTFNASEINDKCMCVFFKEPNSYTGENMVEFQCHGSMKLAELIQEKLIQNGCVIASAGEFTKRAFINGKISLDEAEGVIDIINSESEAELKAGYSLMKGKLAQTVKVLQDNLTMALAKLEVAMDYPEEDLEQTTKSELITLSNNVQAEINKLLKTSSYGLSIKTGYRVLIIGKTNVGKSSLMNALLNYDRAIVTPIKGTTRDTIEETYLYNGVKFVLVDTAGIRESNDEVELMGINRTKQNLNNCDIVLLVLDASEKLSSEDKDIMSLVADKNTILVVNKCDLFQQLDLKDYINYTTIFVSAQNGKGIDSIKSTIYNKLIDNKLIDNNIVLTNRRHINALTEANKCLDNVLKNIESTTLDIVAIDLKNAWDKLGLITGVSETEEIINTIFEKFCVGK